MCIRDSITTAIERDKNRSHEFAILLSGLSEIDSDCHALSQLDSAITRDRRWWLKLKQKINGSESRVSEIPVSTRTENSISFPLLIEGTENTAGMESGVIQKLD